tara:strand:+ start:1888 stop:2235 length:348 start_codon:yes stop_codon:yes gene_type:complete
LGDLVVREMHLPGHNYTGPFTNYKQRQKRGDKPVNRVDALSERHDGAYEEYRRDQSKINHADFMYVSGAANIVLDSNASRRERSEAAFVGTVIGIKGIVGLALLPQLDLYRKLRY